MILGNAFYFDWEIEMMAFLQQYIVDSPFLIGFLSICTDLGEPALTVLVLGFLYWAYDKEIAKRIGLAMIFSSVFNCLLKNIFLRYRPYFVHSEIECLKLVDSSGDLYDVEAQGFSFPSAHSMSIAVLVHSLCRYFPFKRNVVIGFAIAFLVGVSRFMLGCHYPSDVLVGWILGLAISYLIARFMERYSIRKILFLACLFSCAGFFYCRSNDFYSCYGLLLGFTLAIFFEGRYVRFANTRNMFRSFIRLAFGVLCFVAVSEGLKMLFSVSLGESSVLYMHLFRCFRYALSAFVSMGIYPMVFRYNIFHFSD